MKKPYNIPLIVAIALPLLFVAIIAVVLFVPSYMIKPEYNFIYAENAREYNYRFYYENIVEIRDGKIVAVPVSPRLEDEQIEKQGLVRKEMPALYVYDVKNDTSREISFTDAQALTLDPGPSSPDGYTVRYEYNHDGIFELFGSNGSNQGYYISKGTGKKALSAIGHADRYWSPGQFTIIGWVK